MKNRRPSLLYKYMSDRLDRIGAVLVLKKVHFAHPLKFDDPFDCAQWVRFPDPTRLTQTDERLLRRYVHHLHKHGGGLVTMDGQSITPKTAILNGLHRSPTFFQSHSDEIHHTVESKAAELGVFCLSATQKSVRLWSQYASDHKGIVIEFDHTKLHDEKGIIGALPVDYRAEQPTLSEYLTAAGSKDPTRFWRLFFCRKSLDWERQEEWRFFTVGPNKDLEIPSTALRRVIFGYRMPTDTRRLIERWLDSTPQVARSNAIPSKTSFTMEIVDQ